MRFAATKFAAVGVLLGAGLILSTVLAQSASRPVFAGSPSASGPVANTSGTGSALSTFTSPLADGGQQLVVIDSRRSTVCVYHIDATGEIALKSVRNIGYDLQMMEFNGVRPLPREIRSLLEQP